MTVSNIANEIWYELESPETPTVAFISAWLRYNIGEMNILLGVTIELDDSNEFSPALSEEQKSIIKKMFYVDYYRGVVSQVLSAAGYLGNTPGKIGWISMREGDSQITRANPNEVAKTFRGMMQDAQKDLDGLVQTYKFNHEPEQVVGDDTVEAFDYISRPAQPRNHNL